MQSNMTAFSGQSQRKLARCCTSTVAERIDTPPLFTPFPCPCAPLHAQQVIIQEEGQLVHRRLRLQESPIALTASREESSHRRSPLPPCLPPCLQEGKREKMGQLKAPLVCYYLVCSHL